MSDTTGWDILTALATATTAATAIIIAIRSFAEAARRKRTATLASLDAIDAGLALERDAPAVIHSATRTQPQVVGFRLETESATARLQDLQREAAVNTEGDE